MEQSQKHWSSKALVLFGMWLWEQGEYGHALLCIHAPQWGLKIGTQLKITWHDVVATDDGGESRGIFYVDGASSDIYINPYISDTLVEAYAKLPIKYTDDSIYMNYKTGKPLTTSTLNRELQRLSEKFIAFIEADTDIKLNFKPLKSNAFEIAWALDMLKKYHHSRQVFSAVSNHMGHRTIKDTIQLLEVEPNERIVFDFENVRVIPNMMDTSIFKDTKALSDFVFSKLIRDMDNNSDILTIF